MAVLVDPLREYPDTGLPFSHWCHLVSDASLRGAARVRRAARHPAAVLPGRPLRPAGAPPRPRARARRGARHHARAARPHGRPARGPRASPRAAPGSLARMRSDMKRVRTLVVVLAGGAGGRLELLTHERAKPAVSFAGTHRLIDFPLSNCSNAGLSDVWIVAAVQPDLALRPPRQRPPVGPRPHGGRPADPAAADGPRRPRRLPEGHGRRALAQRADDPRVRARGARRRQRRRRLQARLRRASSTSTPSRARR